MARERTARIPQTRIDGAPVRAAISSLKYPTAICARIDDAGVPAVEWREKKRPYSSNRIDGAPV